MRSIDSRITFDAQSQVMEIDLSDLHLATPAQVIALYDALDAAVEGTGRKWFFLINYLHCRIEPAAWVAFATRGKRLNVLNSLGTARFNTAEETSEEIAKRADVEKFEANLAANRSAALARIDEMRRGLSPKELAAKPRPVAAKAPDAEPKGRGVETDQDAALNARISFHPKSAVMEADFEDFTFSDSLIVHAFYDLIEQRIAESGREKWYFLVNYRKCRVFPEAWVAYSTRGKRLNVLHSLGSVRYAAADETAVEIAERAKTERFDPNLFPSRAAAMAKIAEMRKAAEDGGRKQAG